MLPESHFTRVLYTNYVPSTKELNKIRHLIIEPQEKIGKLNEEIARLQAERDELQQLVDGHFALAAPFWRFPADIWGEIYAHCLPVNKMNVAVCTVEEAPLLLTAVCRAWREIALSTPRLWSSVHFSVSDPPPSTKDDPLYPESWGSGTGNLASAKYNLRAAKGLRPSIITGRSLAVHTACSQGVNGPSFTRILPPVFPFLPHVKDIYSSIITPHLSRLTLQLGTRHGGGPSAGSDVPFHMLIKGHLVHLQIIGYHIVGADALSRCLQAAPLLATLKLQPEQSPRWFGSGMGSYRPAHLPSEPVMVPPTDWVPKLLSSLNELNSCPRLEVLDCGRCRPEDVTSILEFVQDESRLSRMKQLRADMGDPVVQQVHAMTSPSLPESLRSLRATHGISVDLKWAEIEPTPEPQWKMDPYSGLSVPAASPYEASNDW
ncbi:hypothetical protein PQX77_014478 [Marasmius sp. AFHP31]|nr:hypothetical protein PQX77_014478 [Marasmius sp. AFHP31]